MSQVCEKNMNRLQKRRRISAPGKKEKNDPLLRICEMLTVTLD